MNDVQLAIGVLCERGDLQAGGQGRWLRGGGQRQCGRGVTRDVPQVAAAEVAEHVAALQRGDGAAPINETTGGRVAERAAVLRDGCNRAGAVGSAGRVEAV